MIISEEAQIINRRNKMLAAYLVKMGVFKPKKQFKGRTLRNNPRNQVEINDNEQ